MALATSNYVWACLGRLDQNTEGRVIEWAQCAFDACRVVRAPNGLVALYARRSAPRSSKSYKMMLRTVFQNWNEPLEIEGSGWLRLLTSAEFSAAVGETSVAAAPREEQCGASGESDAPAEPTLSTRGGHGQYLTCLSAGFDERAAMMYKELLEREQLMPCCA